jgi:hypothetical protein
LQRPTGVSNRRALRNIVARAGEDLGVIGAHGV